MQVPFQVNENRLVKVVEDKIAGLKELVFIGIVSGAGGSLVLFLRQEKTGWEGDYGC